MEYNYPLLKDLYKQYKAGELKNPNKDPVVYHASEETAKHGSKYLIYSCWEEFIRIVEFIDKVEENNKKLLWDI